MRFNVQITVDIGKSSEPKIPVRCLTVAGTPRPAEFSPPPRLTTSKKPQDVYAAAGADKASCRLTLANPQGLRRSHSENPSRSVVKSMAGASRRSISAMVARGKLAYAERTWVRIAVDVAFFGVVAAIVGGLCMAGPAGMAVAGVVASFCICLWIARRVPQKIDAQGLNPCPVGDLGGALPA